MVLVGGPGTGKTHLATVAGVNYLDRPATTILAGWKRGMNSSMKLVSASSSLDR